MDLIKKFFPKQKTIQTLKVDAQGFRKTINKNPPTQEFFKNPPGGPSMFKNVSNQKTDATLKNQLFEIYNFAL